MSGSDPQVSDRLTDSSPVTWPHELGTEWKRRTRYGRTKLLLMLPVNFVYWATALVIMVALAIALGFGWVIYRILSELHERWPDTHRGAHSR